MSVAAAGYLARRAAQKERVRILYRRALKDTLNWAVHRHLFYEDADLLRARFENNKHVEDPDTIDRMIADGEAQYNKWRHPDPYIVPWAPGGSKFTRNPTPPEGTSIGQEVDTCVWFSPTSLGWELMSLFRMESAPHDLPILLSTSSLNLEKIISAADPDRSTADSFFLKSQ